MIQQSNQIPNTSNKQSKDKNMLEFLILLVFLISCALISIFGSGLSSTVEHTIYITQNIIQKVILLSTFILNALGKIGILVILGTALFILSNDFLVIFWVSSHERRNLVQVLIKLI